MLKKKKLHRFDDRDVRESSEEVVRNDHVKISLRKSGSDHPEGIEVIASEVKSLIKNNTWYLADRPGGQRIIGSRFVLRNKYKSDGTIDKRKARVVAQGFGMKPEIDFHETFAPVARLASIRAAVAVAFSKDMKIRQLDITTAYLNGIIKEKIFMEAPKHLEEILDHILRTEMKEMIIIREEPRKMMEQMRKGDMICLLNKDLYGLPQTGRA